MTRRRISDSEGREALTAWVEAQKVSVNGSPEVLPRKTVMTAVRWSLEELAERHPGRAVEVRVPPAGAVQIFDGTTHRRGTPPSVIETHPDTWLSLVSGKVTWDEALASGTVQASGQRSDLREVLPL